MSKIYKTWEVIKMLTENPELKFQTNGEIKGIVYISKLGYLETELKDGLEGIDGNVKLDTEWSLIQKPVSFVTAVNSGKRIKYEKWSNYLDVENILISLTYPNEETIPEMINGKWYIEE